VKSVVAQLRDKGTVTRGWIGVQIQPVTRDIAESLGLKEAAGALVSEPEANSPAAKAGIASGSVIMTLDSAAVRDARELSPKVGTMAPGTSVKLGLIRGRQEKTVTLTLGTLPNKKAANQQKQQEVTDSDVPKLGLTLAPGRPRAVWWSRPSTRMGSPPITAFKLAMSFSTSAANRSQAPRMSAGRSRTRASRASTHCCFG
jgi:hypothetical protein